MKNKTAKRAYKAYLRSFRRPFEPLNKRPRKGVNFVEWIKEPDRSWRDVAALFQRMGGEERLIPMNPVDLGLRLIGKP